MITRDVYRNLRDYISTVSSCRYKYEKLTNEGFGFCCVDLGLCRGAEASPQSPAAPTLPFRGERDDTLPRWCSAAAPPPPPEPPPRGIEGGAGGRQLMIWVRVVQGARTDSHSVRTGVNEDDEGRGQSVKVRLFGALMCQRVQPDHFYRSSNRCSQRVVFEDVMGSKLFILYM